MGIVASLVDQLEWHWDNQLRPRLEGLTDEEYLWEPVPGCWSLRPKGESVAPVQAGEGDIVIEFAFPEPDPAPVTTIAWRLGHVVVGVIGVRAHSHFGGPEADYLTWDYATTAQEALEQLDGVYASWLAGVRSLTPETLALPVGPAEHDWAEAPMLDLVLHINRETIHHLAEVALLRDLWANR